MSRRRRRREEVLEAADAVFLTPLTPLADRLLSSSLLAPGLPLTEIEDRRTYHPDGLFRAARSTSGAAYSGVTVSNRPFKRMLPFGLKFVQPDRVMVCVRRKRRKEVLHALQKTGRGAGRRRRPRRNFYSAIGC